jgi:hypothetical protein
MSLRFVLLPLLVQVALTFVLLFTTGGMRTKALRTKAVHPRDIALRELNWPARVMQFSNAYQNQLELPLLFYVLTILSLMTRQADLLFVLMSWVFVALRFAHAYIHITHNRVTYRGMTFGLGAIVLLAMWIIFTIRIML